MAACAEIKLRTPHAINARLPPFPASARWRSDGLISTQLSTQTAEGIIKILHGVVRVAEHGQGPLRNRQVRPLELLGVPTTRLARKQARPTARRRASEQRARRTQRRREECYHQHRSVLAAVAQQCSAPRTMPLAIVRFSRDSQGLTSRVRRLRLRCNCSRLASYKHTSFAALSGNSLAQLSPGSCTAIRGSCLHRHQPRTAQLQRITHSW